MYRSDNDRSIKAEEHNLHKYNSKNYIADNRLQYGMYRLVEIDDIRIYEDEHRIPYDK